MATLNIPGEVLNNSMTSIPQPYTPKQVEKLNSEVKYSRSVVLVLDETFASQHALRWTLKHFVRPSDDELVVLAVLKGDDPREKSHTLLHKYASFTVDQFKGHETNNLSVTGLVVHGDIHGNLLKKAQKVNATSIIIGCNDQGDSLLANSLRSYLAEHSSIPLVLVRAPPISNISNLNVAPSPPVQPKALSIEKPPLAQMPQGYHHHKGPNGILPRDKAIQSEIDANPEWFISAENLGSIHPKKKQAKTAERYLRIRNFILDEWAKDTTRFLTKTSARRGLLQREGDVNAIGRVFDFLQTNGYINYGTVRNEPTSGLRKRKSSAANLDNFDRLPKIISPFGNNEH